MKSFIKQWMLVFGLVVASAFIVPSIIYGSNWDDTWFILKLLVTTLTICLLNLFWEKNLSLEIPYLKHFISMCSVLAVVFVYGWFWKWYTPSSFWIVFVMVIPVYVIVVLLDAIKTRHDVEFINRQIQHRKRQRQEKKTI